MKNKLLVTFFIISSFTFAQKIDFGIKGGLIFNNDNGKISTVEKVFKDHGKGSAGFQAGILSRISLTGMYIQPELLYSQFSNKYYTETTDFKITKKRIDIPVNFGKKILNIAHIQAGPVFSYYLEDGISLKNATDIKQDDFNVGLQIGAGARISKLLFDLRYEYGFGKTASKFISRETSFSTESTPRLLNISVAYLF